MGAFPNPFPSPFPSPFSTPNLDKIAVRVASFVTEIPVPATKFPTRVMIRKISVEQIDKFFEAVINDKSQNET